MIHKLKDLLAPPRAAAGDDGESRPGGGGSTANPLPEDCLACRIVGTGTFGGLSLYTFYQRTQIPAAHVFHRTLVGGMGLVFLSLAVTRAVV